MADGASGAQEQLPTRGRGRRRSRSHSVRPERSLSRQLKPGAGVLIVKMSKRKLLSLPEEHKEKLRNIMRKFHKQKHFNDSRAASGARDEVVAVTEREEIIRQNRARSQLWRVLYEVASPIPEAEEFVEGIDHYNSEKI